VATVAAMVHALVVFAAFAAVLTVTPGLDTMLVLRTAALTGRRAALAAVAGIALGCLAWAVASALGVTAVLTASEVAFTVLRVAGAIYLCWLGYRALRPRPAVAADVAEAAPRGAARAFRTGFTTNMLNPKVGVFYLSVLPQFLPDGVNPLAASVALAGVHVLEGLVWLSLLVVVVGWARTWLIRPTVRRRLEQITGVVFVAFGVKLATDAGQ
jgi:RhtB (resistance to homoserine/threonine) family protein